MLPVEGAWTVEIWVMHACVAVWTRTADFLSSRLPRYLNEQQPSIRVAMPSKARLRKKANAIIAESVTEMLGRMTLDEQTIRSVCCHSLHYYAQH